MCGLTGFWDFNQNQQAARMRQIATQMADRIQHRGPDSHATWVDEQLGLALAHRRLAIVDLSPLGAQPMASRTERFQLVYNGELYNFPELRRELEILGHKFRGQSDTEVMLACFEQWGIAASLAKFIGMFAIVVWDARDRQLHLIRDRLGKKPLYWGWRGKVLLFGSELSALTAHPAWHPVVDRRALSAFVRLAYVPAPLSIYEGISQVQPGHWLVIDGPNQVASQCYWSLPQISNERRAQRISGADLKAETDHLEDLLKAAVSCRMIADVPLGAFLSGGVDSSLVVALMQSQSSAQVKTFSIGFNSPGYNEAEHAKAVAQHLGCEHTELYVGDNEALDVVPRLANMFSEPFGDSSQIPTYLVSQMTRRHVTVALSGDGGDEVFAGYNRYQQAKRIGRVFQILPHLIRRLVGLGIIKLSPAFWDRLFEWLPASIRLRMAGDKMHKLAALIGEADADDIYKHLISFWPYEPGIVIGEPAFPGILAGLTPHPYPQEVVEQMQLLDQLTYLPDDILTKVDRASMAVSLEARAPLLDHRVVEYGWQLPMSLKIHNGQSKYLLRQVLYRHVPQTLIDRPKMGFAVPLDSWLRGPLRDWAEDLLNPNRLEDDGYLNSQMVRTRWREHLSGRRNWQYSLWNILMFQAWKRHWLKEQRMLAPS